MPSSIIDQAVEPAVTRNRSVDQIADVVSPGDIAVNKVGIAGSLLLGGAAQPGSHARSFICVVAADDDLGARIHKLFRTTLADAAAATGDNYDFICVTHVSHWRSPRSPASTISRYLKGFSDATQVMIIRRNAAASMILPVIGTQKYRPRILP